MTPEQKLKDIVPGRRYRVEFEATAKKVARDYVALEIIPGVCVSIIDSEAAHPSFKIEPIKEPIKVGDAVRRRTNAYPGLEGEVVAVFHHYGDDWAVVTFTAPIFCDPIRLADLERVK